ncbi:MAG: hypothetical protein ACI892_001969, partial [Marinobacter maritimus]
VMISVAINKCSQAWHILISDLERVHTRCSRD